MRELGWVRLHFALNEVNIGGDKLFNFEKSYYKQATLKFRLN